jgi:hypothetical protein
MEKLGFLPFTFIPQIHRLVQKWNTASSKFFYSHIRIYNHSHIIKHFQLHLSTPTKKIIIAAKISQKKTRSCKKTQVEHQSYENPAQELQAKEKLETGEPINNK